MPQLTKASAAKYDSILSGKMTPEIAVEYLREERIVLRTFGDVLRDVYSGEDVADRIVAFYMQVDEDKNLASVQRKVRNWIADRHPPSSREDVFRIAFALGLDESKLNYLLGTCDDYGIQYRNGRELVLAWFLRIGGDYRDATDFYASLPQNELIETSDEDELANATHEIHYNLSKISTADELRELYIENLSRFGNLHLRAYYYFEAFMNQLVRPSASWSDIKEESYSVDRIMEVYLLMHMPSSKKRDNYSLVQKLIKKNWPNATLIKNIRNHKEDVSRKLLLLLYVVTENEGIVEDDYDYYDEDMTLERRIDDHWWKINAMLNDCGMRPLDLRNAFDWLILYSIATDDDTPMSERLEEVIKYMFEDVAPENDKNK